MADIYQGYGAAYDFIHVSTCNLYRSIRLWRFDVAIDREYRFEYDDPFFLTGNAARTVQYELPGFDGRISSCYDTDDHFISDLPETAD